MSDSLEEALDRAAIAILARANGEATVKPDEAGGAERVSLKDQIAAFEAISRYSAQRSKANPPAAAEAPPQKESRFASIKREFNGHAPARRRGSGAKTEAAADHSA